MIIKCLILAIFNQLQVVFLQSRDHDDLFL